jgi:hypothetical protein
MEKCASIASPYLQVNFVQGIKVRLELLFRILRVVCEASGVLVQSVRQQLVLLYTSDHRMFRPRVQLTSK